MKRSFLFILLMIAALLCLPDRADSQRRRRRGVTPVRPQPTAIESPADRVAREQEERPLTEEEQRRIADRLFASQRFRTMFRTDRVRALSIKLMASNKDAPVARRIATVVVFNYAQGTATRFQVDAESGEPLTEERLRGRPQASPEEKQEAADIIRGSDELARLLRENNQLEGGFVVDDPRGRNTRNRFLQFHILSPDRSRILRLVVVDLTERRVADARRG
jgi:hypothetical protein